MHDFSRESYLNYLNNNNNNNNNNNVKTVTTINIPVKLKGESMKFAESLSISWSKMISEALIEYMINHKGETKRSVNLTMPIFNNPKQKALAPKCEIGDCHKTAVSIGLHASGKKYNLCAVHTSLYSKDRNTSKDWKLEDI